MAVEARVLDVLDSIADARVFRYSASRPGTRVAFSKVRLVVLSETRYI